MKSKIKNISFKINLFLLLCAFSLNGGILEIISSKKFQKYPNGINYLLKNVHLKYGLYNVKCDTAKVYNNYNNADLFGHVVIYDNLRSISSKRAKIIRSTYDNNHKIYLEKSVKIDQDSIQIRAQEGKFYNKQQAINLSDSARAIFFKHPTYLRAENLTYNYQSKFIFAGKIAYLKTLYNSKLFDLRTKNIKFLKEEEKLLIPNPFHLKVFDISSETITQFKDLTGFLVYELLFNKAGREAKLKYGLEGLKATYYQKEAKAEILGDFHFFKLDSLTGDSLNIYSDKAIFWLDKEIINLDQNVLFIKDSLRASSENAIYQKAKNRIIMLNNPKILLAENYLKGDTIKIVLGEKSFQLKSLEIVNNVQIEQKVVNSNYQKPVFNQLKGKSCRVLFKNNQLDKLTLAKEAKAIYYLDQNKTRGSNYLTGDTLKVWFEQGKINNIEMIGGAEGRFSPSK